MHLRWLAFHRFLHDKDHRETDGTNDPNNDLGNKTKIKAARRCF